jgi:transcriptional regulator with XRE-family HTH domain
MSLEQVAQAIGTNRMQISRLETGARETTVNWLAKIAPVLGANVSDLLPIRHSAQTLSVQETSLLDTFRSLDETKARIVITVATALATNNSP